jgi:hypothetical protein
MITYDPINHLYTLATTEVLRRNSADIHKETHSNEYVYTDIIAIINTVCKYLPPVYTSRIYNIEDICETDPVYMNIGKFNIQYEETYLHEWHGYINNNGTIEDSVDVYLYNTRRSDIHTILEIWLTTLREKIESQGSR